MSTGLRERASIIRRARKLHAEIEQHFTDIASWNDNSTARKAGCDAIDPDPDGKLRRLAYGLSVMLANEAK